MKYIKIYEDFKFIDFIDTEHYEKGEYVYAITDVAYNAWNNKDGIDSDVDMFNYMESNFGKDFKMICQISGYNSQVCNGGHSQYWINGYASADTSGCMADHKDCGTLSEMVNLISKSLLIKKYDSVTPVWEIMLEFMQILEEYDSECDECHSQGYTEEHCDSCNGEGNTMEECCDDPDCSWCEGSGSFEEECEYCDGNGEIEEECGYCDGGEVNLEVSHLDNPYYEIYEKFMEDCNDYSKKLIDNYYNVNNAFKKINN